MFFSLRINYFYLWLLCKSDLRCLLQEQRRNLSSKKTTFYFRHYFSDKGLKSIVVNRKVTGKHRDSSFMGEIEFETRTSESLIAN